MKPIKPTVATRIKQRLEEFADALERGDTIQERFTCRKVRLELKPMPYAPESVRQTRLTLRASQAIFALLLGVSIKTVQAWEQGNEKPSKIACRFMDEIRRSPKYWINRIKESVVVQS
jgi:putative transcriptional regulator